MIKDPPHCTPEAQARMDRFTLCWMAWCGFFALWDAYAQSYIWCAGQVLCYELLARSMIERRAAFQKYQSAKKKLEDMRAWLKKSDTD